MNRFTGKGRPIILVLIVLLFLFFTNDFGAVNIEKAALIVAAGVDYDGDVFRISCQIAEADTSSGGSPQQNQIVVTGEDKTITGAIENIKQQTGWTPNFLFCYIIAMGEPSLEHRIFDMLDFFVRDNEVNDAALLCACEGKAEDFLKAKTTLDNVSAYTAMKILYRDDDKSDSIIANSLKDLSYNYFSKSKGNVFTLFRYDKEDSGSNKPDHGNVQFYPGQAVVFDSDTVRTRFDMQDVQQLSRLTKEIRQGAILLEDVADGETVYETMHLSYTSAPPKLKFKVREGKLTAKGELELSLKINTVKTSNRPAEDLSENTKLSKSILALIAEQETKAINEFIKKIQEEQVDVIALEENAYKRIPKFYRQYYKQHPDGNLFQDIEVEIKVSARNE